MKLLVLSDSHGDTRRLDAALERHADVDAVVFLGDGLRDLDWVEDAHPHKKIYAVRGNNDYFSSMYPAEGLAPFGGVNVFYTHGHLHDVKHGLDTLAQAALARGADVALFGHTHQAVIRRQNGVLLFNPGAVGGYSHTGNYGVLTVENGVAQPAIYAL